MTFTALNLKICNVPYSAFSQWLGEQMERERLTQEALGRKVGVRHVTVGKWLKGVHTPEPKHLDALAEVFGVNHVWLYQLAGNMQSVGNAEDEQNGVIDPEREALYREIFQSLEGTSLTGVKFLRDQARLLIRRNFPLEPIAEGQGVGNGERSAG